MEDSETFGLHSKHVSLRSRTNGICKSSLIDYDLRTEDHVLPSNTLDVTSGLTFYI